MQDDLPAKLRATHEHAKAEAMDHACVSWPIKDRADLLEAFNCILDVLGVPDADGDVFEPEKGLNPRLV
jgi:hypothetical protein